jgi:hypothetical protein
VTAIQRSWPPFCRSGSTSIEAYRDHTVIHPTQFHTLQMFPLLLRTCTDTECKKHYVTFCDLRLEFLILSTVHIHALPKSDCQREPTASSTRRASKNPFRQRTRGIRIRKVTDLKTRIVRISLALYTREGDR